MHMDRSFFRQLFNRPARPAEGLSAADSNVLEARANRGEADAKFSLGLRCATGCGAAPDYTEAARWYRKAAQSNHALAQFNLGIMYDLGQGMFPDKARSMSWLLKAACLGDPGGQHRVGLACQRASQGASADEAMEARIEAYKWLRLAAAQGYQPSDPAWRRMTLDMTHADVAEGNRRIAAFEATRPQIVPGAPANPDDVEQEETTAATALARALE